MGVKRGAGGHTKTSSMTFWEEQTFSDYETCSTLRRGCGLTGVLFIMGWILRVLSFLFLASCLESLLTIWLHFWILIELLFCLLEQKLDYWNKKDFMVLKEVVRVQALVILDSCPSFAGVFSWVASLKNLYWRLSA